MTNTKPTPGNNLIIALVGVGGLMVLGLLGVLIILDKDPSVYVGSITAVLTTVVGLGLVGRNVNKRLDVVGKNVNGKMSSLLDENARLRHTLEVNGVEVGEVMDGDEVNAIIDGVNQLPSHDGQPYTPRHQRG